MIEPLPKGPGVQRARGVCDDCGKDEVVAAKFVKHISGTSKRSGERFSLDEQSVRQKLIGMGWAEVKGTLRCPACEAKRKTHAPKPKEVKVAEAPKEPTRAQKREIMDFLEEVYDVKAERYKSGETDHTVAEVLNVLPGFVAKLREEFFGPDGGNEDIEELKADVDKFISQASGQLTKAEEAVRHLKAEIDRAKDMSERLERIKAAVGPRKLKLASAG